MVQPVARTLESLVAELESLSRRRRTLIVGIDGRGGSGKSTISTGLLRVATRSATIVELDDFYRPSGERGTPADEVAPNFDWRRLRDEVLAPLNEDQPGRYQRYDWEKDTLLAPWRVVPTGGVVLVEGVSALRSELRNYYDYTIWVECPFEERLTRGLARDGEEARSRWLNEWMPDEERYVQSQRPDAHAALLVDGSADPGIDPQSKYVELARQHPTG